MCTYSSDDLENLEEKLAAIPTKKDSLIAGLYTTELSNRRARKYLEQGVLRRISILAISTIELFRILPPETVQIPSKKSLDLATIHLQANIFNTSGLLDCWAHVWAKEFDVRDKKSKPLGNTKIGLGKNYTDLRGSMTASLTTLIDDRKEWLKQLQSYRHAVAHRIPLYIPPTMVDPSNEKAYSALNKEWYETLNPDRRKELDTEMLNLSHFKSLIAHDLEEDLPVFLHAQTIVNFLTIEEISYKFAAEIFENRKQLDRVKAT